MENYVFIRVVGKGSYGEVNLVQHKSDRKQYVIKKLNLRTSSKRERRAAEQEAQLLSQLKHPNIVTYRESWEGEDCQLYIAMGFCEGGDLYHRLKQQKGELLPERQVVEWFVQIAMALQYLHEKHILHRDLKTQNIFLTKTNIIKVGDLGIARVLENQNDMASTLIGTPYYMSPELFSNKPYNYKSDVWALGCCVYEMATLKHAFNAKDMNSLAYRIIEGKLPQMPSKYDPQLGELIKRMLCKRPEDRPDVKHILRQPYIKQQIAIFLEATKEKTAKSRKKATNSRSHSTPNVPVQENSPQCLNSEPKSRKKSEENNRYQRNAAKDNILPNAPLPQKSSSQDALNSTGQSIATISNVNIDIQPPESQHKMRKAKPPRPTPTHRHAGEPPAVIRRGEREEKEKEDPSTPQTHPRKQASGDHNREDERLSHPFISQSSSGHAPPKPTDRLKPLKENKAPNANMALEEDTMKLLQQAEMERIAAPCHTRHSAEIKMENQASPEATGDHKTEAALRDISTGERRTSLESTDKLLEPFVPEVLMEPHSLEPAAAHNTPSLHPPSSSSEPSMSRQRRQRKREKAEDSTEKAANSRPLPPLPEDVNTKGRDRGGAETAKPFSAFSRPVPSSEAAPQNRLLSARERRRLRQLQENQSEQAAPAVRRASCDVSSLGSKHADQPDCPRPASVAMVTHKERKSSWRSDEEECSSSTSSTERSEGDYREGKSETNEMQDLVQMMTQTLRMDVRDISQSNCATLPEFKLNRKYRDTLMLHGKASEGDSDFHFSDFPSGDSTGPAKIRRAIEHLRADVVKGLGVKLLDKVLDIMQVEDEEKREVLLRQQMGEEKYKNYAVMVRQLKFFEDVAFKD
ncbi:serine/threonine-protein kinase Nek4 [Colossoma macropomum]|uniref:serine/threonine-protein kinase Nek4 n=1 Tax=Colossoma macropomum TaxID=42526 RepID=UPI001864F7FE|nr:serine/threonine-protein kinase Nek4 [Colossoma macropomum]